MNNDELREAHLKAKVYLLQMLLENEGRPISISEIIGRANGPEGRAAISSFDIRSTIWSLVEEGKAEFTPDRKVRIKRSNSTQPQQPYPLEPGRKGKKMLTPAGMIVWTLTILLFTASGVYFLNAPYPHNIGGTVLWLLAIAVSAYTIYHRIQGKK